MIQGITIANQAMNALLQKQELIANNLANTNTTGFKQSNLFVSALQKSLHDDALQPYINREVAQDEVFIDYRQGVMKQTGNSFDVMIQGSGFFSVMTPQGVRYTRNGNFSMDRDSFLVASDGSKVLGRDGYIRFTGQQPVVIHENGEVLQENETKGFITIVDFKKPYEFTREGSGYFKPLTPDTPVVNSPGFVLRQGFLEGSNVNAIYNMVAMISAMRIYEADQKALIAQDQTLEKAVNTVGRVG
ncbi:MAG: flagellar basal-body rod protein FlgF [Chitinivibrionales bacterium]|nr:flagellar basal-body rod protein FlgF [Chitinivibrionales bacterium]